MAAAAVLALVAWATVGYLKPFEVSASVFRVRNGLTEPLAPGGTITMGDSLFVEIEGTKDLNAYVFAQDDAQKSAQVLYPSPAREDGRLAARRRHHVPHGPRGRNMAWPVNNPHASSQVILIVAGRSRVAQADSVVSVLAAIHRAQDSVRASSAAAALAPNRGLDPPVDLPAPHPQPVIDALKRSLAQRTDVQVLEFDFRYRSQ